MNKVILIGRLTKDPEIRYTASSNKAVCSFTIAVNRRFTKQGEERQADFIPVVTWDKQAEFCNNYFKKGMQVAISGRIQTRTWDDNEGKRHYITEIVADETYFADSRRDGAGTQKNAGPGQYGSTISKQGFTQPQQASGNENADKNMGDEDFYPLNEEDDELPF